MHFFASVFTNENENTDKLPPVMQQFHGSEQDKLCDFNITPNTVKQKLCKLKNNKSPGDGSVGTKMLMGHLGIRHLEVSVPHCR